MKTQTIQHACGCEIEHQVYGNAESWAAKVREMEGQICWKCRKAVQAEAGRATERNLSIKKLSEQVGQAARLAVTADFNAARKI